MSTGHNLLSTADIARTAGVTYSAVSNWKRRYDNFPMPAIQVGHVKLYARSDVEEFLRDLGYIA